MKLHNDLSSSAPCGFEKPPQCALRPARVKWIARYPDAVREVLRVADGRLSRAQAEHITAKVINTIAKPQ
jgi:hypothetical protein